MDVLFMHYFSLQVYWAGPLAGSLVAAWTYDLLFADNATPTKLAGCMCSLDYDEDDYDQQGEKVYNQNMQLDHTGVLNLGSFSLDHTRF